MYIRSVRTEESPIPPPSHTLMSSSLSPPATPVIHCNNHGGLHATSPISIRSTNEASTSNASSISLYVKSREPLPTTPSAHHSELVTNTGSIILPPPAS